MAHISYTMSTRGLPDMYTLSPPRALGVHVRQITRVHGITITYIYTYIYISYISYSTLVLYSKDRYEIIWLCKSAHSIKQPCSSICLVFTVHQSC